MSDGLTSYIQQGQPQQVIADQAMAQPGGPPVSEVVTPGANGEPSSGVSGSTSPSGSPYDGSQGVTTPDPRDEAIRQLQEQVSAQAQETEWIRQQAAQQRYEQAVNAARIEEAQILSRIQGIEDDGERERQRMNYELHKAHAQNNAQGSQLAAIQTAKEQESQTLARNSVAAIRALQEGIPFEFVSLLKRSETPQELENHLAVIKRSLGQGQAVAQQASRQEIVNSGVYAAGGTQAGYIPPEMPQPHSGDLAGLIAATPPRFSR